MMASERQTLVEHIIHSLQNDPESSSDCLLSRKDYGIESSCTTFGILSCASDS